MAHHKRKRRRGRSKTVTAPGGTEPLLVRNGRRSLPARDRRKVLDSRYVYAYVPGRLSKAAKAAGWKIVPPEEL